MLKKKKKKNLDLPSPPQGIEHTETSAFQRRFNPGSLETRGIGPRHHPSKRSCENRPFYSATRRNSTRQLRIPVSSPIYLARVATNFRGRGGRRRRRERLPPFSTGFVHVSKLATARSLVASGPASVTEFGVEGRGGERCAFRAKNA